MPDDTELGIWLYARRPHGELDRAELVPVGPLRDPYGPATRRQQLDFGLDQVAAVPEVRTGLYDTVLAAYRAMQRGYDPKLVNSLLLLTDGTNDDPGGIPLPGLLAALRGEYDPTRPVQIVIVGFGDNVDRGALDPLSPPERLLFPRFSIFVGPFGRTVAETIAADAALDVADVDDLLSDLAERSMLLATTTKRSSTCVGSCANSPTARSPPTDLIIGRRGRGGWCRYGRR